MNDPKRSRKEVTITRTNTNNTSAKAESPMKKAQAVNAKKASKSEPCKVIEKNEGKSWYFIHI